MQMGPRGLLRRPRRGPRHHVNETGGHQGRYSVHPRCAREQCRRAAAFDQPNDLAACFVCSELAYLPACLSSRLAFLSARGRLVVMGLFFSLIKKQD